jgi:hypothetical protein
MLTEKEMVLPPSDTVMLRLLPEKLAVTDDGLGGRVPSSYFWSNLLISACRQVQSALLETLPPPWKVKGSFSALETGFPRPSGTAGQAVPPPPGAGVVLVGPGAVVRDVLSVVGCWGAADELGEGPAPGMH